jgi:peptidyl-prolyl cis-trans isomerase A (cyclophilin A)
MLMASKLPLCLLTMAALCACPLQSSAQEAGTPAVAESAAGSQEAPAAFALVNVVVHTSAGDISLALEKERAPLTTANFLRYVDQKRFDGATFYRAVKLDEEGRYGLVQGGLKGDPKKLLKPVRHEAPFNTGLSNISGAVSMARGAPGTAASDFFIVVGDLVSLDGKAGTDDPGYAVFGHVVDGMDVVKKIMESPRSMDAPDPAMKGQMIAAPVKIQSVRRVD